MPYLNCPRCGFTVQLRDGSLTWERCPHCLTRRGQSVSMFRSEACPGLGRTNETPTQILEHARGLSDMPEPASYGRLRIRTGYDADAFVLALHGDLDLASAPQFESAFIEAESAGPGLV